MLNVGLVGFDVSFLCLGWFCVASLRVCGICGYLGCVFGL